MTYWNRAEKALFTSLTYIDSYLTKMENWYERYKFENYCVPHSDVAAINDYWSELK